MCNGLLHARCVGDISSCCALDKFRVCRDARPTEGFITPTVNRLPGSHSEADAVQ